MTRASCHGGQVVLDVAEAPGEVTDCNCSICRRYGVLRAYCAPGRVEARGETDTSLRDDRAIAFHRCRTCGCVTHWRGVDPGLDRVGVNGRLMAPEVLARARVRHLDGAGSGEYLD